MRLLFLLPMTCASCCACSERGASALPLPDAAPGETRDVVLEPLPDAAHEDRAVIDSFAHDVSVVVDGSTDTGQPDIDTDRDMDGDDAGTVPEPRDAAKDAASPLCGCTPENAIDQRGISEVMVSFSCCTYAPRCLRISAGTTVRFLGNFVSHPLGPSRDSDPGGPPLEASSGAEASFQFPLPGSFGYYCTLHGFDQPLGGMCGAVLVEP